MKRRAKLPIAVLIAAAGLAAPAAAADDVNAEAFYQTARQLLAKGVGALFDSRTKALTAQMNAATTAVRAENLAATQRGTPLYCISPAAKKGIGAQEAIAKIGRLPEAQRRASTLRQAWRAAMIRDYPCR